MAETVVELEEPLFLDEPPDLPKRIVRDDSDIDALFAFEPEPPAPAVRRATGSTPLTGSPAAPRQVRMPLLIALVLLGVAAGFALVTFLR